MDYKKTMEEITAGLTGNSEIDIRYLNEQTEKYKNHELSKEILRAIGRMLFDLLSGDKRDQFAQAVENDTKSIEAVAENANYQLQHGNTKKAVALLESIIPSIRTLYIDDDMTEYRDFEDPVENVIYVNAYHPTKNVVWQQLNRAAIFRMYGYSLVELKRFEEAKAALETALIFNPVSANTIFEYAELFKMTRTFQPFIKFTKKCLEYAYTPESIARAYRNLGYYYIEQGEFDIATALYYVSLDFDKNKQASSELFFISQKTGDVPAQPNADKVIELFEQEKIQLGASKLALGSLAALSEQSEREERYDLALLFTKMLYRIDHHDSIAEKISELEKRTKTQKQ